MEELNSLRDIEENMMVCKTAYEACHGADAVVLATDWDEFCLPGSKCGGERDKSSLDWQCIAESLKRPAYVFDGYGVLDRDFLEGLGLRVESVGYCGGQKSVTE